MDGWIGRDGYKYTPTIIALLANYRRLHPEIPFESIDQFVEECGRRFELQRVEALNDVES